MPVAVKVTGEPLHTDVCDAEMLTVGVTDGLTVIVTGIAVAVATDGQVADDVMTTVTTSPFVRAALA